MTRQDYERRFRTCPDVVTIPEFCAILRIGDNYARRLLRKIRRPTSSSAAPAASQWKKSSTSF